MTLGDVATCITSAPPATWGPGALEGLTADYPDVAGLTLDATTKYNPTPGTGRTGYLPVPPNNYPFYNDNEKSIPVMQADGGQLSEWKPMYNPTAEQAEKDRAAAYASGIPHGYVSAGDKYAGLPTITLKVVSDLHTDEEYGEKVKPDGEHYGGPFDIQIRSRLLAQDVSALAFENPTMCSEMDL
ncbi:hypothetical protein H632_c305p0 [Helicosporidium sp. ATCC 50920]|nr:hypothetical protein H632_c305p0 [Helicosporidium sp. ATCC 50920]|eukprot:KDD76234.1 hypothetical protein H632_c305p0 [Helicosporidium sp. ATCC 50920]